MLDYLLFILVLCIVGIDDAVSKLQAVEHKTTQANSEYELPNLLPENRTSGRLVDVIYHHVMTMAQPPNLQFLTSRRIAIDGGTFHISNQTVPIGFQQTTFSELCTSVLLA